jgi:hypothetical protein
MGITVTAYSPYEGYPDQGHQAPAWAAPVPQPTPRRRKRKLLAAFIVIVVLAAGGFWAANFFLAPTTTGNDAAANAATALAADNTLNSAYSKLGDDLTAFGQSTENCGSNLPCATKLDTQTGRDFKAFAEQLATIEVPVGAAADQTRLTAQASVLTQDFTKLSHATSTAQYAATLSGTGVEKDTTIFQQSVTTLDSALKRY